MDFSRQMNDLISPLDIPRFSMINKKCTVTDSETASRIVTTTFTFAEDDITMRQFIGFLNKNGHVSDNITYEPISFTVKRSKDDKYTWALIEEFDK